jgi:hypothetical protein
MERIRRRDWRNRVPVQGAGNVAAYLDPKVLAERFAERDAREALPDTRRPGDVYLGDPHPAWQSALAKARPEQVADAMLLGAAIGGALRRIAAADDDAKKRRSAAHDEAVRRACIKRPRQTA